MLLWGIWIYFENEYSRKKNSRFLYVIMLDGIGLVLFENSRKLWGESRLYIFMIF